MSNSVIWISSALDDNHIKYLDNMRVNQLRIRYMHLNLEFNKLDYGPHSNNAKNKITQN